ncbi:MAG: type III polyketide synthase [Nannocystaceae bacterium]|nr:type III polyketide synthase [Nannocystaceae bacterium]
MMPAPCVRGLGTALPEHAIGLHDAEAFARRRFAALPGLERLLPAFAHTGIAQRHLVRPLAWFESPRSFAEKNAVWAEGAVELGTAAATQALAHAELAHADIAAIVWVTSTGIATPSLDAALVARLGLRRDVQRLPLWGLGCAGGAAGLARAAALCRGLQRPVLLVAAEICSATFVAADCSRRNLVATALFADGAAAAVLAPQGPGPRILGGAAQLLPDSEDVMGWDLRDEGLQVRFARSIPALVQTMLPEFVTAALHGVQRPREALRHFALHPGGAKVLAAYQQCLGLDDEQLAPARAVLQRCGNMSSPTALFVLQQLLARGVSGLGVVVGLGPGFCAEAAVFEA